MSKAEIFIKTRLNERQSAGNYRELKYTDNLVDLCSNDYLGFARSVDLKNNIDTEVSDHKNALNGSTGSRLLAGNIPYTENLEQYIADFHGYEAGLIYNSGYDANLGLFSSLAQRVDTIITDELIHASIIDGARLSQANRYAFKHNDMVSLEEKLKHAKGHIYIAVESIYSMDGDAAPLAEIIQLAQKYAAQLIVDEAHAVGVFGKGLVDRLNLQAQVFAQVVTFGKALGCHGAIVLGSRLLRNYLINFSRSFIYTTAAPFHQLASVKMAYGLLKHAGHQQEELHKNIAFFKEHFPNSSYELIPSDSAIQCILLRSNTKAQALAALLQDNGFDVRAIRHPTVATGAERLRLCIHAYNTKVELEQLLTLLTKFKEQ